MDDISTDWLALVENALSGNNLLPPLEEHFPFPWETAADTLREKLDLESLKLSCIKAEWKQPAEFLQGMHEAAIISPLELSPVEGHFFLIFSQDDVADLTSQALDQSDEKIAGAKLREGFYRFLLLKTIHAIDEMEMFKDFSFHLLEDPSLPQEEAFCVDVACTLSTRTLRARLIFSQLFIESFKAHIPFQKISLATFAQKSPLELTLRCNVGRTRIKKEDWDTIRVGDFLILDRCSFDPKEEKGSITAELGNLPLFVARVKNEGLKVLEFALYREEPSEEEVDDNSFIELTAQVSSIQTDLATLLHLKPESMISLPSARPEQGIDVMVDGASVAKAELLKLGQTPGLRILSLSTSDGHDTLL